mmetsp:Transcript_15611/g.12892  ORF Transcript_15611/g.12892 Transcript_15611/m.12892 type:complete len:118 (-) Transcript_15611:822-1175(-)
MSDQEAELFRMKEANKLVVDYSGEESALRDAETALNKDKEVLRELEMKKALLSVKEEFNIPGVNGRLVKRIGDQWIPVDFENEDIDETMSLYEEEIDDDGQVTRTKLTVERIREMIE